MRDRRLPSPRRKVRGAFFYDPTQHKLSQGLTILQVRRRLKREGVVLHCHAATSASDVLTNVRSNDGFILMAGYGGTAADRPLAAMLSLNLPVFAIIRGASASLRGSARHLLVDDRLTMLIRNTNLVDLSLNNVDSEASGGRYHVRLLAEDEGVVETTLRDPAITEKQFKKLFTGYSIATYPRLNALAKSRWHVKKNRPIDVSFVGSANYGTPEITRHRQLAVKKLTELSASGLNVYLTCTRSRNNPTAVKKYKLEDYYAVLGKSKIALSPWGLGEVCIRDFEAILAGALMIKPDMSHVVTNPSFYRASETYIACRRDFADLPDLIDQIVNNWHHYDGIRKEAHRVVKNARKPQNVASQVAALVFDGLALHDARPSKES